MATCDPAVHRVWDVAFPDTPTSGHCQNASQKARSQLLAKLCQDSQFCDFFGKSL